MCSNVQSVYYMSPSAAGISRECKLFLVYLANQCTPESPNSTSVSRFVAELDLGWSERTISRFTSELQRAGLITTVSRPDLATYKKGRPPVDKIIHWDKIQSLSRKIRKSDNFKLDFTDEEIRELYPHLTQDPDTGIWFDRDEPVYVDATSMVAVFKHMDFPDHPFWNNPASSNAFVKALKDWQIEKQVSAKDLTYLIEQIDLAKCFKPTIKLPSKYTVSCLNDNLVLL